MNANYVKLGGEVLIDLRNDTVTEEDVFEGRTFHKADGSPAVGTGTGGGGGSTYDVSAALVSGEQVDVVIQSGATKIRPYAFYYANNIASVDIPSGVTSIGNYAFQNCTAMTDCQIPESVTSIGQYAFRDCSKLGSVIIPDGVTEIMQYAFFGLSQLKHLTIGSGVTTIANHSFYSCKSLESIIVPDNVITIGKQAFYNCQAMSRFTIGNGVTSVGENVAVQSAKALVVHIKADAPPTAGANMFSPTYLISICVPYSEDGSVLAAYKAATNWSTYADKMVEAIDDDSGLIYSLSSDKTSCIIVNSDVEAEDFEIPAMVGGFPVTGINVGAFSHCKFTNAIIPDSVTSIGDYAFYECGSISSVTIPDSVTSIGDYAFQNCTKVKNITIGNGVNTIGAYAFGATSGNRNSVLQSVTIPGNVKIVGGFAFASCTSLRSVVLEEGVEVIEDYAFYQAGYNSTLGLNITFPSTITSIGTGIRMYLGKVTVRIRSNTPPTLASGGLGGLTNVAKIYVPYSEDGSVLAAYKAATNWSTYADKMEEETPA